MQFLIIGKDGTDDEAMQRRLAVRDAHLRYGNEMEKSGNRWYGSVILDDDDRMIGSMAVMDFPSQQDFDRWLACEPYVTGDVWRTIEVMKCNVKNPWKFNRPQAFFDERMKIKS